MKFKELHIGARFEFDRTGFSHSGLEEGPWYKVSSRHYAKETNPTSTDEWMRLEHKKWSSRTCEVGTTNVNVIAL